MLHHVRIMALVLAIVAVGPVGAGPGPASASSLSGLAVKPKPVCLRPRRSPDPAVPAPTVVSTFPAEGAVVRPGLVVLRFTFNVAMSCDGLFQPVEPLETPCGRNSDVQWTTLTYDRATIRMPCILRPNTRYGLWMNPGPDRSLRTARFSSLAGQPLQPFKLTFSTSSGPAVKGARTAEAEDAGWPPPSR